MSYVDKTLLPEERVTHRTHLNKIMFFWPAVVVLIALPLFLAGAYIGATVLLAGVIGGLATYLRYTSSEFAVTNRRVIIKIGLVRLRTLEMLLSKIEAITVDQGIGGRIFGYGAITVIGTGGTKETFDRIADPLEFRRAVQAATV